MHPVLLRLGVAATLIIEIPFTFFSVAYFSSVRKFSVWGQLLLQMVIALTGNYTYFNLLTAVLTIPVWCGDDSFSSNTIHTVVLASVGLLTALFAGLMFKAEFFGDLTKRFVSIDALSDVYVDLSDNVMRFLPVIVKYANLVVAGKGF